MLKLMSPNPDVLKETNHTACKEACQFGMSVPSEGHLLVIEHCFILDQFLGLATVSGCLSLF